MFTPNWKTMGFATKKDGWRHVLLALKKNEKRLLSNGTTVDGQTVDLHLYLFGRRFTLSRPYKKKKK